MFWMLLIGLFIVTFPLNVVLLRNVWYRKYPPRAFEVLGTGVPDTIILGAQFTAIMLFGLLQPALAAIPMAFGGRWYHWVAGGFAAVAYAASGSPASYLDRVRSSHVMFIVAIAVFVVTALIVRNAVGT